MTGNENIDGDKIRDTLTLTTGSTLDYPLLHENAQRIQALYRAEGFYLATVGHSLEELSGNAVAVLDHLYGELEVGGPSWMYLAGREFTDLGMPKVGNAPAPGTTEAIQHGIFAYFIPPVALYALLGSIMWMSRHRHEEEEEA